MASDRADLAARQLALVTALVAGGPPPAGVDETRIRIQATALLRKRSRSVARRQPELAAELGQDFWPAFQSYDQARTGPPPDCSTADAKAFARYLRRTARRRRAAAVRPFAFVLRSGLSRDDLRARAALPPRPLS